MSKIPALQRLLGRLRWSSPTAAAPSPGPSLEPVLDAFCFRSPLTLAQMMPRLEAGTPWPWRDGDSAYFDYLLARIGPGAQSLRIYPEGRPFVVQARRPAMDDDLRAFIVETLLPLLDAEEIMPTEGFD